MLASSWVSALELFSYQKTRHASTHHYVPFGELGEGEVGVLLGISSAPEGGFWSVMVSWREADYSK